MSKQVTARYQSKDLSIDLPDSWRVIDVAMPSASVSMTDVTSAVLEAVSKPVGCTSLKRLCQGVRSVAIAIDDQTRPTPTASVLRALLPDLREAGIGDADVTIIIAKGTHRWPTDAEIEAKVGRGAMATCRVMVHDPDKPEALKIVGTTTRGTPVEINRVFEEADLRLAVGGIVTHYMAGYGGGPKIILPGVSSRRTIQANHFLAASPDASQSRIDGNPMYEDLIEAATIARLAMKIDVLVDMESQPIGVIAGEVAAEHRAAIERYDAIYGYAVRERADITIASGYPLETELLQSCKAVLSADLATKDGGAIVLLTQCVSGIGPGFGEAMSKKPCISDVWEWVRTGETTPTGGPMVARVLDVLRRKRVILVSSGVDEPSARSMGFDYAPSAADAVQMLSQTHQSASVLVFPAGSAINPLPEPALV